MEMHCSEGSDTRPRPWSLITAWIRGLLTEEGYSSCNVLQPEELEPSLEFSAAFIDSRC